jgi:chemotaxis-related protein WspB
MLFLLFDVEKDRYVIDIGDVVEVLPLVHITPVPQSPPGVAGVINYRGAPVPVIDLSMLLRGRQSLTRLSTRLVLVRHPDRRGQTRLLGVIAEHATTTIQRERQEFVAAGVSTGASYLGSVTTDSRGFIRWISVANLLPGLDVRGAVPRRRRRMNLAIVSQLLKDAVGLDVMSIGESAVGRAVRERQLACHLTAPDAYHRARPAIRNRAAGVDRSRRRGRDLVFQKS